MSETKWSRKRFRCAYCNKIKTGLYRIVDGEKSCGRCNREGDPPEPKFFFCPLCKGKGGFDASGSPLVKPS